MLDVTAFQMQSIMLGKRLLYSGPQTHLSTYGG